MSGLFSRPQKGRTLKPALNISGETKRRFYFFMASRRSTANQRRRRKIYLTSGAARVLARCQVDDKRYFFVCDGIPPQPLKLFAADL